MKPLTGDPFDGWRVRGEEATRLFGWEGDETCGAFRLSPCADHRIVAFVIASTGAEWDHVSVSLRNRCPTWDEMVYVKRAFFGPDETVAQLHPPENEYVNWHRYCLHLWKPQAGPLVLPPASLVGPKVSP